MDAHAQFQASFAACPLIAIIRGVEPAEVEAIGGALVDAGFRIIEVPLNSPRPFHSIEQLARRFGSDALIGGGTVLDPGEVSRLAAAGGRIAVSPNTDPRVIRASLSAGLASVPGYFTPTEAFAALDAGAHALKLFPAEAGSPALVRAHRAVLPRTVPLLVVGGVRPEGMAAYLAAGADGFGLGGALYRPGATPAEVGASAREFIAALAKLG